MKGREGLKIVRRLCHLRSVSGEGGLGVDRSIPQLRSQTLFESSSSVDVSPSDLPSNIVEDLTNKSFSQRVLSFPVRNLQTSNFTFSIATYATFWCNFPHIGSVSCSPVLSLPSFDHVFNKPFRVSAVPFATLKEIWQEDKEDEEEQANRHNKQGANKSSSHGRRVIRNRHTGRVDGSELALIRDILPESKVLISKGKAVQNSHDDELGSVRREADRDGRWSEMGWNREEVFNWPNAISTARLLCGPLLAWMILHELWSPAFVGLVIAGLSDWLDGHVARKMNINSVLGSYLDPVADKFLVGSVAISMAYMGLLHPTLVGLIVARDAVLVGGAFVYRAYTLRWQWNDWQEFFSISMGGAVKVEPLSISKVNTVFQLTLVGVALLQPALAIEDTYSIVPLLSLSVVVTTSISWVAYAYVYWKNPERLAALQRIVQAPCPKPPQESS